MMPLHSRHEEAATRVRRPASGDGGIRDTDRRRQEAGSPPPPEANASPARRVPADVMGVRE